jgi:hypothetical protein
MAYSTPNTVSVGDAVKKDDYDKLKNNSIDHEARVAALEVGAAVIVIIDKDISNLSQYVNAASTLEGLIRYQAKQNLTLSSAILTDTEGATSGTFEFDILKATTIGGTYTTVFSTKPSITANGSAQESSNAAFSVTSVSAGDWLRFDITSVAVGAKNINVSLTASAA